MEPEAGGTAVGACGRLIRVAAGRAMLAWVFLQLLLHQSVLLHEGGVLDRPLDQAVQQARLTVLSREVVFLWNEVPGWKQAEPFNLTSLEEWAHQWLAALGTALDVDTWRVVRRSRDPLVLGLTARSPDGIVIDLWLQSSPWALGQAGNQGAPSLTLRLQTNSPAGWEALTSRMGGWIWPRAWQDYPRPQMLLTYRLQGTANQKDEAVEGLAQALAARLVKPPAGSGGGEMWLATPRAAPLPAAFYAHDDPKANVRLRWLPDSGGNDSGAARRRPGAPGEAPVLELVLRPHSLSTLGQLLGRMTPPHIQGKSWTG